MHSSLPIPNTSYAREFRRAGYAVFPSVLPDSVVEELQAAIESLPMSDAVRRKRRTYGVRNLLELSTDVRSLAASAEVRQFVTPILGEGAFAVRAVFFDKVPDANWALGWHQDSVISVKERRDVPGFSAWGDKAGVWQVQPPPEILAKMLAVRVHLDDCHIDNGPLRVIAGSHRSGWLDECIDEWKQNVPESVCCVNKGGVVVMCPLTLHASSKAVSPSHRRVIHLEFANAELPGGLEWNIRFPPVG